MCRSGPRIRHRAPESSESHRDPTKFLSICAQCHQDLARPAHRRSKPFWCGQNRVSATHPICAQCCPMSPKSAQRCPKFTVNAHRCQSHRQSRRPNNFERLTPSPQKKKGPGRLPGAFVLVSLHRERRAYVLPAASRAGLAAGAGGVAAGIESKKRWSSGVPSAALRRVTRMMHGGSKVPPRSISLSGSSMS